MGRDMPDSSLASERAVDAPDDAAVVELADDAVTATGVTALFPPNISPQSRRWLESTARVCVGFG